MYQANQGFIKREIAGEVLLVPVGSATREFNGMVVLNETAAYLWDLLSQPQSEAELLEQLLAEFSATREEAAADLTEFLQQAAAAGVLRVI